MSRILFVLLVALVFEPFLWITVQAEQVIIETTECDGEKSFANFDENRLMKIIQGDCENPDKPGEMLQQVLLRGGVAGAGSFDIMWVTRDEARNIMAQIRGNKDIRQKSLQKKELDITVKTEPAQPAAPAPAPPVPQPTAPPASATQAAAPAPAAAVPIQLAMIDPPITRSSKFLVTDASTGERQVVGKISPIESMMSLTINGKPITPNTQGVFKETIKLKGARTPVKIVAVDQGGETQEHEFWLVGLGGGGEQTAAEEAAEGLSFGAYHALLIGINDYQTLPKLETAISDVEALDKLLSDKYGYKTRVLINANRYDILSMLNSLRKELTEKDNLLLYYAGHGEYDRRNNRGHWLPADAEPDNPANWISTIDITDNLNRMSAKQILVVSDSCYSGALTRASMTDLDPGMSKEARLKYYQMLSNNQTRMVLSSGGIKPVLDGDGSGHSIFARAFIEQLNQNDEIIVGEDLYKLVSKQVTQRSQEMNMEQNPQYAELKSTGHKFGDFIFVPETYLSALGEK